MASVEITSILERAGTPSPTMVTAEARGWKPAAMAADIATLGTGTLVAGLFNVALVFVVPRLTSVEDYGYWRMFALYAGYVGFLHFGFADGALLRWAGRPLEELHPEIGPAVKYLFWQHMFVLVPLCMIAAVLLAGPLRFVAVAVAIFAPIYNITATLQFGLQGARIFRPVAISTVTAPALFFLLVLLWASRWHSEFREIIILFVLAWCVPLVFLLNWTKPWSGARNKIPVKGLAESCVLSGWPIVLTNTGLGLVQYADRLAVSWVASIQNFAQYSMAASAMAVPITAIQACSRVVFSHLAGVTTEGRKRIYGISSWALLVLWAVLLPYYFALDSFVRHYLPRYMPSVQYSRILLLGIPFMAVIQVLQMSYAYLNGTQKRFLARTVAALVVSLSVTSFAAFHTGSLRTVAGVQVAILGLWWLFNEWALREWTGQEAGDWAEFTGVYLLTGTGYWLTSGAGIHLATAIALYYLAVGAIVGLGCRNKLELLLTELRGAAAQ
jgi:O-antigen/teichoic acid export membrane protein